MSKKTKVVLMILICIGLILASTKVNASTGKLINDTTRLRKEASTDSDIIDLASVGETVEILSEEGEWYKVKYSSKTGYIRKDMLEVAEDTKSSKQENAVSENTTTENTVTNTTMENATAEDATTENTVATNTTVENKEEIAQESRESLKAGDTGKISSTVEIKILPTITSSVIATIYENTEISIKDVINKWCYIETNNTSGWVLVSKVKNMQTSQVDVSENKVENEDNAEEAKEGKNDTENKVEDKAEETTTANEEDKKTLTKTKTKYVSTETLNVRENPQNDAKVVKQLTLNTAVIVSEEVDSTWSKITAKGVTGYVASKYLSDTKTEITSRSVTEERTSNSEENTKTEQNVEEKIENENNHVTAKAVTETTQETTISSSSEGAEIVAYAKQFLGNPYVYGGTSLTNGCDCSGFVMSVYNHFGYSLPHSSSSMQSVGVAVDKSELQMGDILCFSGHVGIYIGGNTFIHAANESKGIITTSLSSSYYLRKYICARRVL